MTDSLNQCPEIDLVKLLTEIVKPIVDNPDEVIVSKNEDNGVEVLTLNVSEKDIGMIIGKRGRIAQALRSIIKAASRINNKKVLVEIK